MKLDNASIQFSQVVASMNFLRGHALTNFSVSIHSRFYAYPARVRVIVAKEIRMI